MTDVNRYARNEEVVFIEHTGCLYMQEGTTRLVFYLSRAKREELIVSLLNSLPQEHIEKVSREGNTVRYNVSGTDQFGNQMNEEVTIQQG
jgi:hypothetical protein